MQNRQRELGRPRGGARLLCAGVLAAGLLAPETPGRVAAADSRAGDTERSAPATADASDLAVSVAEVPRAPPADPDLFDELEALEDPELASYTASGELTDTELVLVIIFIIVLFPVGIILLIVFLLDED